MEHLQTNITLEEFKEEYINKIHQIYFDLKKYFAVTSIVILPDIAALFPFSLGIMGLFCMFYKSTFT